MSEAGESNPDVLSELERTLALLAFEKPQNSPFADLLKQAHRQKVSFAIGRCGSDVLIAINCLNRLPAN